MVIILKIILIKFFIKGNLKGYYLGEIRTLWFIMIIR